MSDGADRGEEAWLPDGGAPLPDGDAELPSGSFRQRVRVVAPRSAAPHPPGGYTFSHELAEQSEIGELFVRSLVRSQLRLAVVVAAGFGLILLGVAV
ncbi:MAG: hypothetical protein ABWX72_19110, partial [Arthrobacter sp.]